MNRKLLSSILIALILSTAIILPSNAAQVNDEPEKSGVIYFDSGDWNSKTVLFYIWDSTTGEFATNNMGWIDSNTWGSREKLSGIPTTNREGIFQSYEIDFSGREKDALYVIFHDPDRDVQTFDCILNSSAIGHTVQRNGVIYETPEDSTKKAEGVVFDGGEGLGVAKLITSTGKIQGDIIQPDAKGEEIVANYILKFLHGYDSITLEPAVTVESVANAIAEFNTNADDVWKVYTSFEYDFENAYRYNYDEYTAKEVIRPSGYNPDDYYDNKTIFVVKGDYGNIDGDDKITSSDALKILRASVNLETLSDSEKYLADVDGDRKITSNDSLEVLRYSVGLPAQSKTGIYVNMTVHKF